MPKGEGNVHTTGLNLGRPAGNVDVATLSIADDCQCSWVVITAGVGWHCISRLKYRSMRCTAKHPTGPA